MSDPNLVEFYSRVKRIQKARDKGFGFEAPGALGRSYYYRKPKKPFAFVKPLLVVLLCSFGLKAGILNKIGAETYEARVEALRAGGGFRPLGGWLMQADPVTRIFATGISRSAEWLTQA